jgi:DNA recombination protein RmuC
MMGEELLKGVLANTIQAGVVEYGLKTDSGEIEFAWNLEDGHYIPIDSKFPDVFELLERFNSAENGEGRKTLKRQLLDKVKKEVERVKKYQNLSNTIDSCILVIPEGVLDIAPELVGIGEEENVFVCSYKDVFPIAHALHDRHIQLHEEGDIGRYKEIIQTLFQILQRISDKTNAIGKAVTTIENANRSIKGEIVKAKGIGLVEVEGPEEDTESDSQGDGSSEP